MKTKLTNNDMARTIVQALYNLPAYPSATNPRVVKMARKTAAVLSPRFDLALSILSARNKAEVEETEDEKPYAYDEDGSPLTEAEAAEAFDNERAFLMRSRG